MSDRPSPYRLVVIGNNGIDRPLRAEPEGGSMSPEQTDELAAVAEQERKLARTEVELDENYRRLWETRREVMAEQDAAQRALDLAHATALSETLTRVEHELENLKAMREMLRSHWSELRAAPPPASSPRAMRSTSCCQSQRPRRQTSRLRDEPGRLDGEANGPRDVRTRCGVSPHCV
jgi:hypothetical protein